ncbi:MAG: endopeptidase La [Oligoflexales bacterium]
MTGVVDRKLDDGSLELPLLPLKDIVVFPNMIVPVFINEDLCINAVENSLEGDKRIFLSAFQVAGQEGEGLSCKLQAPFDVYDIGTVCSIMRTRKLPDGRMKVLVQGLYKAVINNLERSRPFPIVSVDKMSDPMLVNSSSEIEAMTRAVRENLEKVVSLGKILSPDILMILEDVSDPGRLADLVASNLGLKVHEAQGILAVQDPGERLKRVYHCLAREIEVYQMQVRIQSNAKEEINRMQREHYLREQMRVIKTELGDGDGKEEIDQLWKKVEETPLNEVAKEEISRQLRRLERMHQDTSEATITRTHIETILSLPWGVKTKDNLDLKFVKKVLDEDHYGLSKIKDRIIEYLAVKKLNPNAKSPIVCFVGPPGVGKTSLGKSIARAIGREFVRIALGGVKDEADIRGHRKTYVGAFPGRVISGLKSVKSSNPIMMLDEIDKLGADHRGDPASALLEVLDPEQNKSFVDHYLGVEFDLSDVMFIANANTLDTIPGPLRDRLEVIEVSGYSEDEKVIIANQYLIPKQVREAGLSDVNINFSRTSVTTIINNYTRESGLRGLEKKIASVCRKIAREFAESDDIDSRKAATIKLTPKVIKRHLGADRFGDDFYHLEPVVGVSLGLAYTQYGGEVMAIETSIIPSEGQKLVLTGKLGEVMKESAQAALSYIRSRAHFFGFDPAVLNKSEMHIHVPAGAVPKDGPSAGTAMATSILSCLLNKKPREKTAMTGEITIHGKVLAIGGLKEKLLAAQREGLTTVILPEKNRAMFSELPLSITRSLEVHFVKDYEDVYRVMFLGETTKTILRPLVAEHDHDQDLAS